jgi:hypothetical protein
MAPKHNSLSEHAYAIMVSSRTAGALPFKWSIVDARTREVVQSSLDGHRTMEEAFAAAGPTLRGWLQRTG